MKKKIIAMTIIGVILVVNTIISMMTKNPNNTQLYLQGVVSVLSLGTFFYLVHKMQRKEP